MSRVFCTCFGLALLASMTSGCGTGLESTVSGTVTLDGKVIGPGVVVFAPLEEKRNPATGTIDSSGGYALVTSRKDGLKAGKYQASVSVRQLPTDVKPGDRLPPGKLLIPEKYESITTSGLEYDVRPGRNAIDIELTST